jgi:hypothetical protein
LPLPFKPHLATKIGGLSAQAGPAGCANTKTNPVSAKIHNRDGVIEVIIGYLSPGYNAERCNPF